VSIIPQLGRLVFIQIDAPFSSRLSRDTGAQAASLTFMVGGPHEAFERARPVLEKMGKTIVHVGAAGNGQAAVPPGDRSSRKHPEQSWR
jgi:3-hydroxyisobutyrate dehydrogenase-like beta-hydroxyacid dehydrogenase